MKNERIVVDQVSRDVIEGKLLTSLDDGAHVAIVCSKVELTNLIDALALATDAPCAAVANAQRRSFDQMHTDLCKLKREAFGS